MSREVDENWEGEPANENKSNNAKVSEGVPEAEKNSDGQTGTMSGEIPGNGMEDVRENSEETSQMFEEVSIIDTGIDNANEEGKKGEKGEEENKNESNKEDMDNNDGINKEGNNHKKQWICGVCNTKVNRNSVECKGCNMWIHRTTCSGLTRWQPVYDDYRCSKCTGIPIKPKGPGRPTRQKRQEEMQKKCEKIVQEIAKITEGKRKKREEGTPEKTKKCGKTRNENSPINKKLKAGDAHEGKAEMCVNATYWINKENKDNKTSLISCGGSNLYQVDIDSMSDAGFVTDEVLQFFMQAMTKAMEEKMSKTKKGRVEIVGPNVVHYIQKQNDKKEIKWHKDGMGLNECDWAIFPINDKDDPERGDGGTHWSLLVYSRKDHRYLHFDPIKGMNTKHARDLHINLLDSNSYNKDGNLPPLVEMQCERQKNGYDCGMYVMMYMATIMRNITEGREAKDVSVIPYKADEMRELLREAINKEIKRREAKLNKLNIIHIMDKMKLNKEGIEKKKAEKAKEERLEKEKEKTEKAKEEKEIIENAYVKIHKATVSRKKMDAKKEKRRTATVI